ncbi:hypothetical protein BDB00DRAFT_815739 [Zychaea mexicana]|uniref:uncharacterized protein n=1 Tax=Zychaea mexicana TaxID=64656 RepID=UPI0022FEEC68|nr:uncharacterized protein BDB00DRAFT_815739 [Zychaea mexicana]KAI9495070.1 hypothetical protein BDB00DRAFT_815739 [Zychaea mexicana]
MTADASNTVTLDNIHQVLKDDKRVKIATVDIDGVLRGKLMHKEKFLQVIESGFGLCSVIFGWDIQDIMYTTPVEFGGKDCHFFDLVAKVDLASYRRIPWENNTPFFFVHLIHPSTNEPLYCCPRVFLQSAVDACEQDLQCTAYCGVEFEFFCFKENAESLEAKGFANPNPLTVGMCGYSLLRPTQNQEFYYRAFDWLEEFRVDVESWHTETGPGVFEAAIKYTDAKEAGDRASLFKTSMKQIALKHGFLACFMSKPYQDLPGCSGHMHFSLIDKQGKNMFYPFESSQVSTIHPHISKTLVHFLAGVLHGLPSILAVLAPTINSYKRLCGNFWTPITVSWGVENRLGAVRVIVPPTTSPNGTRLEMRVSGADINPHLAIGAILKCGIWGIKTCQTLPVSALEDDGRGAEQSSGGEGGKDKQQGQQLARTLQEAVAAMDAESSVARQVLGDSFVDHFVKTRKHEWSLWQNAVTDYELKRYMELV